MSNNKPSQFRATLEDTLRYQEEFRVWLDKLSDNNDFIRKEDRGRFYQLYSRALLGVDFNKSDDIFLDDGSVLKIKDFSKFIRHIVYYDSNIIDKSFLNRYGNFKSNSICIGYMWNELKFVIYGMYSEAVAVSHRTSKEQKPKYSGKGYYVGPRDSTGFEDEI